MLDEQLQEMRARYRAQEGRDLQILILSDHGHNHAGSFKRVEVRALLEKAGYRITESIQQPKDVVLPTTGIEDWVEIHNAPGATKTLMPLLTRLEGADLVTGQDPDQSNRFLVMNSRGERAGIDWNPTNNTYRYSTETRRSARLPSGGRGACPQEHCWMPADLPPPTRGWRRP